MSKKAKLQAQEQRRKQKRAQKDQQRAQYERWRDDGTNKKSARAKARAQRSKVRIGRHLSGDCTNDGCTRCNPNSSATNPWLASPGSCLYPKRWRSAKWRAYGVEHGYTA